MPPATGGKVSSRPLLAGTRPQALSVWSTSPDGGAAAVPGSDLVLEVPLEHGLFLPRGAALDDHLDLPARARVDRLARERFLRWRERRSAVLTVDGLDLTAVWELELVAQCFVQAARVEVGLPVALEASGARTVVCQGLSRGLSQVLRVVAGRAGAAANHAAESADGPGLRWRGPPPLARAAAAVGVPRRVRGHVVCFPYWNVTPVLNRLARRGGATRPVASGVVLTGVRPATTAATAVLGGWLGHPGAVASRRARQLVAGAVGTAHGAPVAGDDLDAALDGWALDFLLERAADTLASARWVRPACADGRIRAVLVPFDEPPAMGAIVAEASRCGVPSLLVQHGFDPRLGVTEPRLVDVAAVWSERDLRMAPAGSRTKATVTGNPGAEHLARPRPRVPRTGRTMVLMDYHSRLSSLVTQRVSQLHLAAALAGVAQARPGTTAVIRPHPATYGEEASIPWPSELRIEVDAGGPLERALEGADACIGAMSTATLQAAAHGVPVVYLDVTGLDRPWPFDGTAVPVARDADEVAEALAAALAGDDLVGQAAALEALGARPGATAAVCDLVAELVSGRHGSPRALRSRSIR